MKILPFDEYDKAETSYLRIKAIMDASDLYERKLPKDLDDFITTALGKGRRWFKVSAPRWHEFSLDDEAYDICELLRSPYAHALLKAYIIKHFPATYNSETEDAGT